MIDLRGIPTRARICKPFEEPKNRFPAWRNRSLISQKYGFWTHFRDPGSGSRGQKSTGSRIRISNTGSNSAEVITKDVMLINFIYIYKLIICKIQIINCKGAYRNAEWGKETCGYGPWHGNVSSNAVLRIRDVYPGSRILIFTHPGYRISDPKTATKERDKKN